ncbi:MAG: hypothetical protein AAF561_02505 [Planctomycetota bacterium]
MRQLVDPTPPPSPKLAGRVSLVASILAAIAALYGSSTDAATVKKAFLVALPLALVALPTGAAGRSTWPGKVGLVLASLVLLAGAAALALLVLRLR